MCDGRQRPLNGADSGRIFRARVRDSGPAWYVTVYASSRDEARRLARQRAQYEAIGDVAVLEIEEASWDFQEAEEMRGREAVA